MKPYLDITAREAKLAGTNITKKERAQSCTNIGSTAYSYNINALNLTIAILGAIVPKLIIVIPTAMFEKQYSRRTIHL